MPEPAIRGRFAQLRPITATDLPQLYALSVYYGNQGVWRLHGLIPRENEFVEQLWREVLCQFAVADVATNQVRGLVVAYRPDFRNGHVWFGALIDSEQERSLTVEAIPMFLRHVFKCFPMRKIYWEAAAYVVEQYAFGAERIFEVEGRLKDHFYWDGKYHDWIYMSLSRERWDELAFPDLAAGDQPDQSS